MFRAAKQNRIFQDVVEQIEDAIISGDLQPGDTLPAERELKDQFQTSRGTLREALRVLEQKGLIEIRLGVGGGSVVKAEPLAPVCNGLDLLIRCRKISLNHLAEFREGVEGAVAGIASAKASENDLAELDQLLEALWRARRQGVDRWREFVAVDRRFHQAMARIAGNPLYIVIHQMVHDNIQRYYERFLPWTDAMLEENAADLSELVVLLKQRDAEGASQCARRHVQRFNAHMMRHEAENPDAPEASPPARR